MIKVTGVLLSLLEITFFLCQALNRSFFVVVVFFSRVSHDRVGISGFELAGIFESG